ncbi:glutamate/tyrosine decarboxylase-like PLP-dependent enzyme [Allocatelliglobosispora scoriae]|uniref:Glutamate/tyrosine decarboxylase-like PLP-dependent enzyme n=1 Tax=Allocatelliglobosispora scoriae TaxID=643052 RepID=A0A841C135_9ACTN|nr:pyridoxal-dependent decarboxylase [Allocatelliglobosispora scoriae]MBB5873576.1 glutamate/tyrosine decarboxylase-like PLP-dependent enzyme [Allocatelliglobosispora scoriae]
MTKLEFETLLPAAADHALAYLRGLPDRPVRATATDAELRQFLGGRLPDGPSDPEQVLQQLVTGVDRGLVPTGHGEYFGYVVGGTLPVAMAADWLTATWDQNCIVHDISPATAVVEEICAEWLIDIFGLPRATSVAFVPACTHAELLCLTVARHHVLAARGWDVATQGMQGAPEIRVLVNGATHAAVIRSLQVLGLGGGIHHLEIDDQSRIVPAALRAALDEVGDAPLIVCGLVGDINTGGIDVVGDLADRVHDAGGWLHLDGAFGMWAAASPTLRPQLVDGIERADSWATDAHKWLNTPYDGGVAMIADRDAHLAALPLLAEYLNMQPEHRHPVEWGMEVSRRSRVFPIWAALRSLGRSGIADIIDGCCRNARRFADRLTGQPGVEILNEVTLNQVLVRFDGPGGRDEHTRLVAEEFQARGEGWAAISRWNGRIVLRLCLINWATTAADVDAAATSLLACHRAVVTAGNGTAADAGAAR